MAEKAGGRRSGNVHLVLTGDLARSRRAADRDALQADLQRVLRQVNGEHAQTVLVPLSITAGDEFQGVFVPDGRVVALVDTVQRELHPVQVRIGIGIGSIGTKLARRSQEMDGQAFVLARQAIEAAASAPYRWLCFRTQDEFFDLAANAIAVVTGCVKRRWRAMHWRRAALRDRGLGVQEIATREGVAQSSVSLSLLAAGYPAVRQAEANLCALIDRRWLIGQGAYIPEKRARGLSRAGDDR